MRRSSCCRFVILSEWVYVDMKVAIHIQTNLRLIENNWKKMIRFSGEVRIDGVCKRKVHKTI